MSAATLARLAVQAVDGSAENIVRRLLGDAFTEASSAQWRRRAETFEWARPRPGDFNGKATAEELRARDARLASLARACRFHARLIEAQRGEALRAELAAMLDDLAAVVA